jgi:hypothetical protein
LIAKKVSHSLADSFKKPIVPYSLSRLLKRDIISPFILILRTSSHTTGCALTGEIGYLTLSDRENSSMSPLTPSNPLLSKVQNGEFKPFSASMMEFRLIIV